MTVLHTLLSGIVGSTAYGLVHAGSDIDRLGIFAVPTVELHGLHSPKASHVSVHPDATLHEARKAANLMLNCNPTLMELLWLPPELYEIRTDLGQELISLRRAFLSGQRVRSSYFRYAANQLVRLENRGDTFSSDTRNRTLKHARHLVRLVQQGTELCTTGQLTIRLRNPDEVRAVAAQIVSRPEAGRELIDRMEAEVQGRRVLPDRPDEAAVERWLRRVRHELYSPGEIT